MEAVFWDSGRIIIGSEGEKEICFLFDRANQFQASLIISG